MGNMITNEEYQAKIKNKLWELVGDYHGHKQNVTCRCKKCGSEATHREDYFTSQFVSCRVCGMKNKGRKGSFKDNYPEYAAMLKDPIIAEWISTTSDYKLTFICPDCGNEIVTTPANIDESGLSCELCSEHYSYSNRLMFHILKSFNIFVQPEYGPSWANDFRYDFRVRIDDVFYLIEMDGQFHYTDNSMTNKSVFEQQKTDLKKDLLASNNGYEVIRIDCNYTSVQNRFEYIKDSILSSKLSSLLDLSSVNWIACDVKSQKSIFYTVCKMYDDGEHDIQKIAYDVGIGYDYAVCLLKHSEQIGYSSYNHQVGLQERNLQRRIRIGLSNGKLVLCNQTKEIFQTISDAKRKYGGAIDAQLAGKVKYAGKLNDGTKLTWSKISADDANQLVKHGAAFYIDYNGLTIQN